MIHQSHACARRGIDPNRVTKNDVLYIHVLNQTFSLYTQCYGLSFIECGLYTIVVFQTSFIDKSTIGRKRYLDTSEGDRVTMGFYLNFQWKNKCDSLIRYRLSIR